MFDEPASCSWTIGSINTIERSPQTHHLILRKRIQRIEQQQDPWDAIPKATPEEIAKLHEPEALRADLDAIVALHERTNPNPYLRVSKESILALAERLKASIDRPMTRREFLPLVMEMQAGYRSDHYGQGVPNEDLDAAFARGERLLPFRAAPEGDGTSVVRLKQQAAVGSRRATN